MYFEIHKKNGLPWSDKPFHP